jgi:hypothetical protein
MGDEHEKTGVSASLLPDSIAVQCTDYDNLIMTDGYGERDRITRLTMKSAHSLRAHLCSCVQIMRMISEAAQEGDLNRVQALAADGLAVKAENEMLGMSTKYLMFTDDEFQSPSYATLVKMFGAGRVRLAEQE